MRLKGTKIENEFRSELLLSKQAIFERDENVELLQILKDEYPLLMSAYILHWTPDQSEDIYVVLVNKDNLLCIEIAREEDSPPLVERMDLSRYSNGLSKINQIRLAVAQELAIKDIEVSSAHKSYYIAPKKVRPGYYSIAEYLWGKGVDIDSDGNSESPEDGNWTELTIIKRSDTKQRIDIDLFNENPLTLKISGPKVLSEKVAIYLADECESDLER